MSQKNFHVFRRSDYFSTNYKINYTIHKFSENRKSIFEIIPRGYNARRHCSGGSRPTARSPAMWSGPTASPSSPLHDGTTKRA